MIFVFLERGAVKYLIGDMVAKSVSYNVYICKDGDGGQYLLQIATNIEYNGELDRAAYILRELKRVSNSYELEYAKLFPDKRLNYDRLFPILVDSFICNEQGGRRINILALKDVDSIYKMLPLSNLLVKDKLRITLETSGWIMGRLLKLISFVHPQGISFRQLDGNNVLIGLEQHHLVVFDWLLSHSYQDVVPIEVRKDDISNAAKAVFIAIGGDIRSGNYVYGEQNQYIKFLWGLVCRQESDAERAHEQFYEVVYGLFGRKFYPSKILPL